MNKTERIRIDQESAEFTARITTGAFVAAATADVTTWDQWMADVMATLPFDLYGIADRAWAPNMGYVSTPTQYAVTVAADIAHGHALDAADAFAVAIANMVRIERGLVPMPMNGPGPWPSAD